MHASDTRAACHHPCQMSRLSGHLLLSTSHTTLVCCFAQVAAHEGEFFIHGVRPRDWPQAGPFALRFRSVLRRHTDAALIHAGLVTKTCTEAMRLMTFHWHTAQAV